uniref:CCR4-NOT transcription complex subunit 1 n=1 Tax=Sipha flava TaxID=143950 RepID=A0A2S2R3Q8_9HEMI
MVSKHVQEETNYYWKKFRSLSSNGISPKEFLDNLIYLNKSSIRQNKEIFSCIMKKLLDKRTFDIGYSRNLLMKYSYVFGGIIEYELIHNPKALSKALQFVLVSLSGRPHSKMFDFGVLALNRFHKCLKNH